ncbi:MAG: phytanoyl-CoA dioxygenase family protein [Gammaproteobacteria bacterium]|nr:phytanoyl-CoA dioxygenase family protein [Gammaproteobacteria bacterium]
MNVPPEAVSWISDYRDKGFTLLRGAVPHSVIDHLLERYLDLVKKVTGQAFGEPFGVPIIDLFNTRPDLESEVYVKIRESRWLEEFSQQPGLVLPVRHLLDDTCGLLQKIPFRIDLPLWTRELAHWHQDYFYVRGNTDVVTVWVPLQDTPFAKGCLSVMPGSHKLGAIEHDLVIGKKSIPSNIFDSEIRMVKMEKGDALLFSALLLHSSNLNISDGIRYSVQPRYTSLGLPLDPKMGGVIRL